MNKLRAWVSRVVQGAGLPLRAVGLLVSRPSTWVYMVLPVILTGVGLTFGLTVGWHLSGTFLGWFWKAPESAWAAKALWQVVHVVLYMLGALFDALVLPQVMTAPLNDRLSAEVERITLGGTESGVGLKRFVNEVWASVLASISRLLRFGLIHLLLMVLALIPMANVAYPVLAFLWSAIWLAQQYLDQTMSRHLYRPADTRAALRSVRPLSLGMGSVLAGLFLIPLANLFLVPVGVVAGSLLYCDLLREGKVQLRPPSAEALPPGAPGEVVVQTREAEVQPRT
jgi:CysZ protein